MGFGFLLNNQMDDFTTSAGPNAFGLTQSSRNAPKPGKRPLSSMTPTIATKDGQVEMVAGGAGGPRIITATTQVILNHLLFDMNAAEAVSAPRVHHQWKPTELLVEDRLTELYNGLPVAIWLHKFGHPVKRTPAIAGVNVVIASGGVVQAAADSRRGGAAATHFFQQPLEANPKESK
jgi:gamma-glutamyltranspeptidase/glutathione hydrolase